MRTLAKLTLSAALLLGLSATQASAVTLVDLVYTGGSSAQAGTGGTAVDANASDVLSFDVVVRVDAAGIAGIGFDLTWLDPPLVNTGAAWTTGVVFTSFAPVTSLTTLSPFLSSPTSWSNIGWFGLAPFPTSTQVFLGSVTFHVSATNPNGVALGFFSTDGASATNGSGQFITPDFAAFAINAPEPGLAALMGLGLLGLAIAGRRSKK